VTATFSYDPVDKFIEEYCEAEMRRFGLGDKGAMLRIIYECAKAGKPIPRRCADVFMRALEDAVSGRHARSWDDVFGRAPTRREKQQSQRKKLLSRVYAAVENEMRYPAEEINRLLRRMPASREKLKRLHDERRERPPKGKTPESVFEAIANRLKIGRATCKQLYYEARALKAAGDDKCRC
jgi:hypothetical protein